MMIHPRIRWMAQEHGARLAKKSLNLNKTIHQWAKIKKR